MSSNPTFPQATYAQFGFIIGLAVLLFLFYRAYLHPLASFPGPRSARYTGEWRNRRFWRGTWHQDILELHRKYGRVVRIAPDEVSIVDGKTMKQLYGHGTSSEKTQWYGTWDPPSATSLFSERDRKHHAFLRKRVSRAYAMSSILKYESLIQESLDELLQKFVKYAGKQINLSDWISAFAYDVVGQLGFGEPLGHLKTETDVLNLRDNIFEGFKMLSCMGYYYIGSRDYNWGQMRIFHNRVVTALLRALGQKAPMEDFIRYTEQRITARIDALDRGDNTAEDMLAHFLRMKRPDGSPSTLGEVQVEGLAVLGAGADTVSIAILNCIFEICRRPGVYQKLQTEIDNFYASERIPSGTTYVQTQSLPYLVAVCKEAMRLSPSIVFQLPRYAPSGGLHVDGKYIPEGTEVGISPLAQNRDTDIWGPDANDFNPSRWLESEARSKWLDSQNFTFGGNGPRMCIGKNIALGSAV